MSAPFVSLPDPPPDLTGFPTLQNADTPAQLFRIIHLRDRAGRLNPPWRFSTRPPGDSRFDIDHPEGTCYWSDRRYGSWVEVFRGTRVVDRAEVTRRALFTTSPPALKLADTLALAGHAFGMTAELSTVVPHDRPQAWARAVRTAGFDGLVGICRHDPSLHARNFAIFGPAGVVARRRGWVTTRSTPLADAVLADELRELKVQVAAVPFTVPITPVPTGPA